MTRILSGRGHVIRRRSGMALAATTLALATTAITSTHPTAAFAPQAGQRIDMKVLLLANSGADPDITAWEANLRREGTPYVRINGDSATLTAATLADGERAKYQGVIVSGADGTQPSGRSDGFSDAEWAELRSFQRKFGIRQLNVNAVPGPPLGLDFHTGAGALDGLSSSLTPEGLVRFPNLAGPVPFENLDPGVMETNGYGAAPCSAAQPACAAASYETLLRGSGGTVNNASLVGIAKMKDQREEMNATFSGNQSQVHNQILRHAMISWVTGGVFIGRNRSYLSVDVDDIFLRTDRWNAATNTTPEGSAPGQQSLRMTAADVSALVAWQNANGVKLNMLFNGGGFGLWGGAADPLNAALLANRAQLAWMNHTFSHPNLGVEPGATTQSQIEAQIVQNNQFAQTHGLPGYNPAELVTGEHSGIGTSNPFTAPSPNIELALSAQGITSVAADASREIGQRQVGSALTLPRHPMNVFYNVSTWTDQLDEYDWRYLSTAAGGNCTPSPTVKCFTTPVTQAQFVDREASAVVRRMIGNDPRPHYAHQANIMAASSAPDTGPVSGRGDGILYAVIGEAVRRYRSYFKVPIQQPGMTALTHELRRQEAWLNTNSDQVSGYIQDGNVTIVSSVSRDVPITGTDFGDLYGGERSGWRPVTGTATSSTPAAPATPAGTSPGTAALAGTTAPPAGTTAAGRGGAVKGAVSFSCKVVKRGRWLNLSCTMRNTSGKPRTARIRALRAGKVVATASGRVRGNRLPTLRIKRTLLRQNVRITITLKLAGGKTRRLTRTMKL